MLIMKDITGRRFGRLVVVKFNRFVGEKPARRSLWDCICDCGNSRTVQKANLANGHTSSCGCFAREINSQIHRTHGHSTGGKMWPTYVSWNGMKRRCENPKHPKYPDYGGRGIKICPQWERFEQFLADMGERPEGLSIERINNDGNYEPGNCKWATRSEQAFNRRPKRKVQEV